MLLFFCCCWLQNGLAQGNARIDLIENRLSAISAQGVDLNKTVTISLSGSLQEFVSFLAETAEINISIDSDIDRQVTLSFNDASVKDILLYCCDAYDLDMKFIGSILWLIPFEKKPEPPKSKEPNIQFNAATDQLTLELGRDTLEKVVRKISKLTGKNIVLSPQIRDQTVFGFINNVLFEQAIKQLADNNDLKLEKKDDYFLIESKTATQNNTGNNARPVSPNQKGQNSGTLSVQRAGSDKVSIKAFNVPVLGIVQEAAFQLNSNYFLLPETGFSSGSNNSNNRNNRNNSNQNGSEFTGGELVSFQIENASFEEILERVFENSSYTYSEDAGVFMIGRRTTEGFRTTKVIQLDYRSARDILRYIPEEMTEKVNIDTLMEYNSLILTGSEKGINEVRDFLTEIDKLVPVVMIELIIVDVQTNKLDEFGVEAGMGEGTQDEGAIIGSGGYNFSFSSTSVNDLLQVLAGRSIINLGPVSSNFYLTLRAAQEDGFLEVRSTPKLSTLNSHDAILSIGEKRYYQEQQFNFPGVDNPIPVQANIFRSVEANLDIKINPVISGDEQVTLDVDFEQSEFLGAAPANAPPPQVSRKFQSMIRVKNGEMVVLGGLERESKNVSKRGIPWLSKIPLLGWLFGSKSKTKEEGKLLIFIKPTIVN